MGLISHISWLISHHRWIFSQHTFPIHFQIDSKFEARFLIFKTHKWPNTASLIALHPPTFVTNTCIYSMSFYITYSITIVDLAAVINYGRYRLKSYCIYIYTYINLPSYCTISLTPHFATINLLLLHFSAETVKW